MTDSLRTRRLDATDLARVAVVAAIVAVLGLPGGFSLFGAVPITAQTLGVMLAGALLGPWLGALSMAVLLALVAAGLPLLAGGRGGIGVCPSTAVSVWPTTRSITRNRNPASTKTSTAATRFG